MVELITYAYLRAQTAISKNIPDDELQIPLQRSQDILKMLLGMQFYEEIESQFPSSFDTDNGQLFDPYIKQFLAWQSYQFWLTKANFKTTPAGIRVHSETNSVVASDVQMATLFSDAKQQAQFYKEQIYAFICKKRHTDADAYSLLDDCDCSRNKMGNGFHITSVARKDNIYRRINNNLDFNA